MRGFVRPAARSAATVLAILFLCVFEAFGAENDTCGPSSRYVVAYYQTWKRQSLMNIDWSKISHLNVAHAIPSDSGEFGFDGEWFLPQLVKEAHKENTKISISLGGWTGSNRMSTIMRDAHKRATLIRAIGTFIDTFELDGVDIDWEYVGRQASKCNKFSPNEDAANFMRFLRALRASLHARFPDSDKIISLAVPVEPFHAQDGPMKDVAPFAEYVDFASIMAFDINGPWGNSTGPNAPLEFQRHRGAQFSLAQAVNQWLDAKWPADKLVAGIAFQGHSMTTRDVLTAKEHADMYTAVDRDVPQGDPEDALWYDVCENTNSMSGVWQYRHLRDQGILKTANTTGDEWIRVWDQRSRTPWLYNPQMRRFISYDDPESVDKKVEFAREKNLKGVMAWALHADYNGELLTALNSIGPLCRGPKFEPGSGEQHSSSVESSSSSSSSSWTPTAPFASLPTPSHSASSEHNEAKSEDVKSEEHSEAKPEEHSEAKSEEHPSSAEEHPSSSPSTEVSPENTSPSPAAEHEPSSAEAASTGKSIMFDSLGAPYLMVNGQSTTLASELAEKLMQAGEKTAAAGESPASATGNSELLPTAPQAIPVVDSLEKSKLAHPTNAPLISGPSVVTNLFNTPLLGNNQQSTNLLNTLAKTSTHEAQTSGMLANEQPSLFDKSSSATTTTAGGFAATFFLTLDTSTQASGVQATTVIPFSQMMASAQALSSTTGSQMSTSGSENPQSSATDSLATSSQSPQSSSSSQ
ncbi:hypothetical protein IWW50_001771 [Coemansia erecta]|nr:hypothetical protein IWW50_001771 [Coemansia erecta]